jgi:amidase
MSVPCGWGDVPGQPKKKLPVGMQIIGRRWDEMEVLKAARVFEVGGGGLGKRPG